MFEFTNLPADHIRITQRFGENPEDYEEFGLPYHMGIDFGLYVGSPVYAVAPGTAILCNRDPNASPFGIYCIIQHDEHHRTLYAHLRHLGISPRQIIAGGEQIGESGNSGNSSGPHLHLQLEKNGHAIDPWPYLQPLLPDPQTAVLPEDHIFGFVFAPDTIPKTAVAAIPPVVQDCIFHSAPAEHPPVTRKLKE